MICMTWHDLDVDHAHFDLVMNYIKGVPTQVSQTVVNLVFTMAEGGVTTKAQLKREIKSLSRDLFNLDLQI